MTAPCPSCHGTASASKERGSPHNLFQNVAGLARLRHGHLEAHYPAAAQQQPQPICVSQCVLENSHKAAFVVCAHGCRALPSGGLRRIMTSGSFASSADCAAACAATLCRAARLWTQPRCACTPHRSWPSICIPSASQQACLAFNGDLQASDTRIYSQMTDKLPLSVLCCFC